MQNTTLHSNSNRIYNYQVFSSRVSPPPQSNSPPPKKRKYSNTGFSSLMGTPVPTYSNPRPPKKLQLLKFNSQASQLSIGIANIEGGIKYFYHNLVKLIYEELRIFKSLKRNLQKGSTADPKLRYINNIIDKLKEIILRIEADQSIFAVLMDNKNEKDKKSYIETLNNMDPKIFYKDFVNILNFYISILMKQSYEDSEDNLIYQHYCDFLTQYYERVLQKHNYGVNFIQDFIDRGKIYRDGPYKNFINKSLEFIKRNYQIDIGYYNKLYDPQFTHHKFTGGRRNKSIYTDMKMKDIKELCKTNQIKLSTTLNDKRVIYTKKELITKLKRKKII